MTICGTAHIPSSDIRCDNESRNAEGIVDLKSSHHGPSPSGERGVAHQYPLSDVACDSDALNVEYDIVGYSTKSSGAQPK